MKLIERLPGVRVWLVVLAVGLPACAPVIRPTMTPSAAASHLAEFWEEPTDLETRDLLHGLWGVARAPDPNATYTFLRKKRQGNNPGVTVTDPHGREWHVKQGTEAQPEVVLSHVLWALGYHQAAEGNRLLRVRRRRSIAQGRCETIPDDRRGLRSGPELHARRSRG